MPQNSLPPNELGGEVGASRRGRYQPDAAMHGLAALAYVGASVVQPLSCTARIMAAPRAASGLTRSELHQVPHEQRYAI